MRRRFLTLALAGILAPGALPAQNFHSGPVFDGDDALVAGSFALATAAAFPLDRSIAGFFQDPAVQATPGFGSAAWVLNQAAVPGAFVLTGGLWSYGRLADDVAVADVAVHMGQALVLGTAVTYALKFAAGRARPYLGVETPYDFQLGRGLQGSRYRAFPSGHATVAFAAAAAAATEMRYRQGGRAWIPLVTYLPAAGVAWARVFTNRHWTSDVIAGAAIGSFAGWAVVRNAHSSADRSVLDEWLIGASVVPGDWGGVELFVLPSF